MVVPPHSRADIAAQKSALRAQKVRQRSASPITDGESRKLREYLANYLETRAESVIAGTWPLPGEIDLRPVLTLLRDKGHQIVLPETTPRGQALRFREWTEVTPMVTGRYGTSYPDGAYLDPTLILVPLLAFDKSLYRLGYGGGYYDRTLASLKVHAVGFAASWQEVETIPRDEFDMPMNVIVTERGILSAL
ncbi:5-formyltetrahydrofolate cyclo-ligase [Acetobacteraceae bacterium EV16G]|uniref:5-formyltetrahydrofolate cyclo-ligase n=1 Tax=Sorlinia euscelidii TaxID=3081148 RepID=A0ABU7U240_9PROT